MTITLQELQEWAGENGHALDEADHYEAFKLIAEGNSVEYVIDCATKWANEYVRVAYCEAREADALEAEYR